MQRHYSERLSPYPKDYYTPKVFTDMTTKHILCSEFVEGVEIDTLTKEN
jgi:predicted unusual protein kinase regulating ubiquinone biosynthesis (AarF/ABC1/UbiB family)